jgi:hypothetical protein
MQMNKLYVRSYYWLESTVVKNLGDYIAVLVLDALGYTCVSQDHTRPGLVNPGRYLLTIGSVVWNRTFERFPEPIDVWGSGWRGTPLTPESMQRITFHAVRGPRTVAGLELSADTPLGDPALLLPGLRQRSIERHGRTLVIPHFYRIDQMLARQRCRLTGCDEFLSVRIIGTPVTGRRISPRHLPGMIASWIRLGIPVHTAWQAIHRIAGADFVLTGSLHGAILAQAYGVPWAAYDDGYIDVPEKWYDWADYLGIRIAFVSDLKNGLEWWNTEGRRGTIRDLTPLQEAFPYWQEFR